MATFSDLTTETIRKLENSITTDRTNDINRWLRDSLVELTGNPDLRDSYPELEVTGPLFNLTGGTVVTSVQEYPETNLLTPGDYNIKTLDIMIWVDFPTNQQRRKLCPTNYQEADKFQSSPSLPTEWYRYGLNIGFQSTPDKNYQVQARVQRRHPITDYFNTSGQLGTTVLLMPNEWFEILEWSAAMRGYMELLNFERAAEIRTMLWGDPAKPNDLPGLIASVKTKRRSESWMQQQPLRPVVKGVTWGSS